MAKIRFIFLAIAVCFAAINAYSQGCNPHWGNWQTAMTSQWGNVQYKVQYSTCNKDGGICGWPKIALEHTMGNNASLSITLKGVDCANQPMQANFSTGGDKIEGFREYISQGNWHYFKTVTEVVNVEVWLQKGDDTYQIIIDKGRGINKVYKNGSIVLANGKTEDEVALEKQKKEEAEEEKIREENATKQKAEEEKNQAALTEKQNTEKATAARESTATEQQAGIVVAQKRYNDSVQLAEENRQARIQSAVETDINENLQAAAITAGVGAVLLNDNLKNEKITGRTTYFKAQVYLGAYNIPEVQNSSDKSGLNYTSLSGQFTYGGGLALDAWLYNNNTIGVLLQPFVSYGIDIGSGTSGTYLSYGGNFRMQYGKKIKFFAEGGYSNRSGTYQADLDATTSSLGIYSNTGIITDGYFDYSTYRYGGGLLIDAMKEENKNKGLGLKLGLYKENPQTPDWDKSYKTPLLYEMQFIADGGFFIKANYSSGYPFAGEALYNISEQSKGNYWEIHLGKVFNLSHSK